MTIRFRRKRDGRSRTSVEWHQTTLPKLCLSAGKRNGKIVFDDASVMVGAVLATLHPRWVSVPGRYAPSDDSSTDARREDRSACRRRGSRFRPVRVRCVPRLARAGRRLPYVPALSGVGKSLTVATLTRIITHGLGERESGRSSCLSGAHSKTQVADSSPIRATSQLFSTGWPRRPYGASGPLHGRTVWRCAEPAGPDKAIPPLRRTSARSSTPTRRSRVHPVGSVIGKPPITSMPHWGWDYRLATEGTCRLPEDAQ